MTLDVTLIIKTFERPDYLDRMIKSIRTYYPDIPVIVADDSKQPVVRKDVDYHVLPFDTGAGAGRNFLVDKVKTKYFITLDDDWKFTPETKIENFVEIIESEPVDILAGLAVEGKHISPCANLEIQHTQLRMIPVPFDSQDPRLHYCDFTPQFFIANVERFKAFGGWDDDLKTRGEHLELFLRAKKSGLSTGITHTVKVYHERDLHGSAHYKTFRRRDFFGVAMKKHGITRCIGLKGKDRKFD